MGRAARSFMGGGWYHVVNRGNGRARVFHKDANFAAFIELMSMAGEAGLGDSPPPRGRIKGSGDAKYASIGPCQRKYGPRIKAAIIATHSVSFKWNDIASHAPGQGSCSSRPDLSFAGSVASAHAP